MTEDQDAENAVLGAVLMSDRILKPLLSEVGLRPEHFNHENRQQLFAAMIAVADEGNRIDPITLAAKTGWPPSKIDGLAGGVPEIGNFRSYGQRVMEVAQWRRRKMAGFKLIEAADNENAELAADAEADLAAPPEKQSSTFDTDQLRALVEMELVGGRVQSFPLAFPKLTDICGGGLRRGQMMLLGGWTSHGKSVVMDQTLERCAASGFRAHLYINEMTPQERVYRIVSRHSGVPFKRLVTGRLRDGDSQLVEKHLGRLPFGITDAAGWSADDVARHMRWHKWDVVGIDILHLFEYDDESDLRRISRTLNQATKGQQANCALIATVHLNDGRATGQKMPVPAMRDIKGASAFRQDADLVGFVYREQDQDGLPSEEAWFTVAKNRNGQLGAMRLHFNGPRMRFEVAA